MLGTVGIASPKPLQSADEPLCQPSLSCQHLHAATPCLLCSLRLPLSQSLHGNTGVKLASLPIVHLERLSIRQTGVE